MTNTYVIPTNGTAVGQKTWVGGASPRPTTWLKLLRHIPDGTAEPVPGAAIAELASGTDSHTWTGLEENDQHGNAYTFTVQEVDAQGNDAVPTGYSKREDGLTVTNTWLIPKDGTATANKLWVDGPAAKPTIYLKLLRNIPGGSAQPVPDAEIKELVSGTTSATWTGLEKTDVYGNKYTFSVQEVDALGADATPADYTKMESGLTVTNTYVQPLHDIVVEKKWVDVPGLPPEVSMSLNRETVGGSAASPELVGTFELDGVVDVDGERSLWRFTFKDQPQTDPAGAEYVYSVVEDTDALHDNFDDPVIEKTDTGLLVTNTWRTTTHSLRKGWVDGYEGQPRLEVVLYHRCQYIGNCRNGDLGRRDR